VNGSCVAPSQSWTVIVEDPRTSCLVAIARPLAFDQAEAVSCTDLQYRGYKTGTSGGNYTYQVWCPGYLCGTVSNVIALSSSDAQTCVQSQYGNCTVKSGQCQDCFPLDNCGGQCVDLSSDNKNCGGCDNQCQQGTTCVYGGCQ
jgi:hypothetical protein